MFVASFSNTMRNARPKVFVEPEVVVRRALPALRIVKPIPTPKPIPDGIKVFAHRGMPPWAREIVADVSARTKVSAMDLASGRRSHRIVPARNEAIYLIRAARGTSLPLLGKWFEKNHTSILYCLAWHSDKAGLPALCQYDLAGRRARNLVKAHESHRRNRARKKPATDEIPPTLAYGEMR